MAGNDTRIVETEVNNDNMQPIINLSDLEERIPENDVARIMKT